MLRKRCWCAIVQVLISFEMHLGYRGRECATMKSLVYGSCTAFMGAQYLSHMTDRNQSGKVFCKHSIHIVIHYRQNEKRSCNTEIRIKAGYKVTTKPLKEEWASNLNLGLIVHVLCLWWCLKKDGLLFILPKRNVVKVRNRNYKYLIELACSAVNYVYPSGCCWVFFPAMWLFVVRSIAEISEWEG